MGAREHARRRACRVAVSVGVASAGLVALAVVTGQWGGGTDSTLWWSVVLVGLAVDDRVEMELRRLRDAVEALADGEDPDLPTESDGIVGDLGTAIHRLAQRYDGDRVDESYRKRLYRITSNPTLDDEEKLQRLLDLGRERLGLEAGLLSRIDQEADRYEVVAASGGDLDPGTVLDLSETVCGRTIQSADILGIADARTERRDDGSIHTVAGVDCYIGGRVEVGGDLYGTLCFFDHEGRDEMFSHAERAFVDLATRWVSNMLERRQQGARLETTERQLELALEATSTGVWTWNLDTDDVHWNETFERLLGLGPGEFGGTFAAFEERVHPEDLPDVEAAIQAAMWSKAPYRAEFRLRHEDGHWVWIEARGQFVTDADGASLLVGINNDITERKRRERELERTKNLLEQAESIASVGGWEIQVEDDAVGTETWTDQLYDILGVDPAEPATLERALDSIHPEDRERLTTMVGHAITEQEPFDTEIRLRPAADGTRWARSIGKPVVEDGETVLLRGALQDITEQKERELALEALHAVTADLLTTESRTEVAEVVTAAATDIIDVPDVGIYLLDPATNRLQLASTTEGFVERCDDDPATAPEDSDSLLWETFVTASAIPLDDTSEGTVPFDASAGGLAVPIGDYGVFVALTDAGTLDRATRQLVETLVATTAAALDRIASEARLRERDAELETQNERLRRQIQLTDIIRSIDQSLIGVGTQADIERTVCERLAETDAVTLAWVGAIDPETQAVEPRTWAGSRTAYLDTLDAGSEPAQVVARTETSLVVPNVGDLLGDEPWAKRALAHDLRSVVAVPIALEKFQYGVLAVYADDPQAFGDLERTVFAELGESIANAMTAVKTREALQAETLLEVTIRLGDSGDVLEHIARAADCEVTYDGVVTEDGAATRLFFSTANVDSETVLAAATDLVVVSDARLVTERSDHLLFEVTVTDETLVSTLHHHGGTPRHIRADPTGLRVRVDLPVTTDIREFLELLRETCGSAELLAQRHVHRETETEEETLSRLLSALTDRQREVLETAYLAGFFERPRETTGQELAELLGVSQPTINRHLRRAQQRLMEQLFERENCERSRGSADSDDTEGES